MPSSTTPVAIFNDTSRSRHFGCSLVMSELNRRLAAHAMYPVWRHGVGEDWREDPGVRHIGGVELVIVNGEGTIHHPAPGSRASILSEVAPFARDELKVPVYLINSTVHEIDAKTSDNMRAFTRIFVRESGSKMELARLGVDSTVVPDLTVGARLPAARTRRGICGTDSVLPHVTAAIVQRCERSSWEYRPMKWHALRALFGVPKPVGYAAFLARHQLVLTGRFHCVTFCFATRTPFVAVESNTPKISSFVHDVFGSTRRIITPEAVAAIDPAPFLTWTPEEERRLSALLSRADAEIDAMFGALRPDHADARDAG